MVEHMIVDRKLGLYECVKGIYIYIYIYIYITNEFCRNLERNIMYLFIYSVHSQIDKTYNVIDFMNIKNLS